MRDKTPIAIFTYNRPEHTQRMLASLAACRRLEECAPIIFSDGPRIPGHQNGVNQVRNIIHDWAAEHGAEVIERPENLGLAHSIVEGVTLACDRYGDAIVLEDDLIISKDYLRYMLTALDRYRAEEAVCQISGYMFPVRNPPAPDALFLPLTTTWGWATWQRAWRLFEWNVSEALLLLKTREVRYEFDLEGAYPYSRILERAANENVDSWGIRFWWSAFHNKKLVLYPRQSLVWQGGWDGSGTNFGFTPRFQQPAGADVREFEFAEEIDFPPTAKVDLAAFRRVKRHLKHENNPSVPERIVNYVRHGLRRDKKAR